MWLRVLSGACLVGLLSACAVVDPVDSRYDTVARSLAKARNESIFLNLIRASHDYPLSFVTVANVTPTMTNTSNIGLPSFLLGPAAVLSTTTTAVQSIPNSVGRDAVFGSTTASNSTAVSTNFNVSTQETSTFYEGFLRPIDLQTLDYFIRQGYSRELLFWLFTDSVEISIAGQTFGTRYNPPNDYGCPQIDTRHRCFSEFVLVAVAAGLTVEEQSYQQVNLSPAGGDKDSGSKSSGGGAKKPETIVVPRFCFSQILQAQARAAMPPGEWDYVRLHYFDRPLESFSPKCGDGSFKPQNLVNTWQPDTFGFEVGPLKFNIVPRSAYGVFEFLGLLIKMQLENQQPSPAAYIPAERRAEQSRLPYLRTAPPNDDNRLVQILQGDGKGRCFVHSWFYDGDYCVPEDAANTKRIFSLLAQLIAITTAATDLSITPSVRVIQ